MQQHLKKVSFTLLFLLLAAGVALFFRPTPFLVNEKIVYHASAVQGLTLVKPHLSTHDSVWARLYPILTY